MRRREPSAWLHPGWPPCHWTLTFARRLPGISSSRSQRLTVLSIQENGTGAFSQDIFGRAAYNHFDDAPVAIGTDEEEVVVELCQQIDDLLFRIGGVNLGAGL